MIRKAYDVMYGVTMICLATASFLVFIKASKDAFFKKAVI